MRKLRASLVLVLAALILCALPASAQSSRLSVQSPVNGSSVGPTFVLQGTATPGTLVDVSGDLAGRTQADPYGRWSLNLDTGSYPITRGLYPGPSRVLNLTVRSFNQFGGQSDPVSLRYAVGSGNGLPQALQLSVNSPTNGSTLRGNQLVLAGTGTPGAQVVVTGSLQATGQVDPYGSWSLPIELGRSRQGEVLNLSVFGRDAYGRASNTTTLRYAVESNGGRGRDSRFSVDSPASGSRLRGNFTLTGTARPGAVVRVSGDLRGSATANRNGRWSIPLSTYGLRSNRPITLRVTAGQRSDEIELRYPVRR